MANETRVLEMIQPYHLPDNMGLNPIFDIDVSIGIPLWAWIIAALALIGIIVLIRWGIRVSKMSPVKGYKDAVKSTDPYSCQVWYFGINGSFSIFCLTLKEKILTYIETKILDKWLITSAASRGSCGSIPMVMVSPTSELVKDPPVEMAICKICKEFNEKYAIDANGTPQYLTETGIDGKVRIWKDPRTGQPRQRIIQGIRDYIFFLPLLKRMYPNGVAISPYQHYDPSETMEYVDDKSTAETFGSLREINARELVLLNHEEDFISEWGSVILIGIICLAMIVIIWQVVIS